LDNFEEAVEAQIDIPRFPGYNTTEGRRDKEREEGKNDGERERGRRKE